MASMRKKIMMGLLAGTLLTTGAIGAYTANAAPEGPPPPPPMDGRGRRQPPDFDADKAAKKIAEEFGVSESEVKEAFDAKKDFRDIGHAAMLAKISGKSFSEVLSMKRDWADVERDLGVTHEQMRAARDEAMAGRLAERNGLDAKEVSALLKEGYSPRDVSTAAKLSKASGKSLNDVLGMKKINNHWRDIAKELGVDEELARSEFGPGGPRRGPGPGGQHRGPGPHRGPF